MQADGNDRDVLRVGGPVGAELQHAQDWLASHARQLMAGVAIVAGGYMAISGLVRLL